MGKIPIQELARIMGVANQDLLFKLKSIGVRIEGENAHIDTEVIQAILHGKRVQQPREVILRDETAEDPGKKGTSTPSGRPAPAPLRPTRPRSVIQKVEPRIRTIPSSERPPAGAVAAGEEMPPEAPVVEVPQSVSPAPQPPPVASAPRTAPTEPHEKAPEPVRPSPSVYRPAVPPPGASRPGGWQPGAPRPSGPRPEGGRPGPARPGAPRPAGGYAGPAQRPGGTGRPSGYPPSRPGAPGAAGARPGASRPGGPPSSPPFPGRRPGGIPVPGAPARPLSAREEADARSREREKEKDKKAKKGVKKPGSNGPSDTDLRGYMGSVQEIEAAEAAAMDLPTSARRRRRAERQQAEEPGKVLSFKAGAPQGTVTISEGMTLREFADKLGVKVRDLIKLLFDRGIVANINHVLEPELAQKLASELGVDAMVVSFEEEIQLKQEAEAPKAVEGRAARGPVVTIMGHVDHGKTSLLDAIRSSNVTATEFGGITQHIGAYHVEVGERKIVFLDTPGHEAFTLMRARGARVTDLVVLVVAADDGVMPQTVEAIDHARAAKVPIIVAINKIDKPNANPDRVKKELADRGLMVEEWGGQTVAVPVSALKKQGIQELLEMIVLNADLLALRCNPDSPAQGTVLEARKEVGRGVVATVLVQNGSLRVGDVYVAGATWGRVRAMADENGQRVEVAGPSTPVGVTGFSEVPLAGDLFQVIEEESKARAIVEFRRQEQRTRDLAPSQGALSLEQIFSQIERGEIKELPVVLKGDVQGSIEVLRDTIGKLSTDKVKVNVIHAAVGAISTNDVLLAAASKAIIVGFNIRPEKNAAELAEKEGIDIRLHTVIYELSDELLKAMTGLLDPVFKEVAKGRAEVRETFKVPKIGVVAGSHVVDGVIPRTAGVRLVRDGRVIYEGKISSLRRFKDDVSEVRSGFDCGIGLDRFQDVKPGDFIEAFVREQIAATL